MPGASATGMFAYRPIRIVVSAEGERLHEEEVKEINLANHPTLHVKRCFLDEKAAATGLPS